MKQRYLTVYDYGTGGVWCYIYAESSKQIETKYPELKVVEKEPPGLRDNKGKIIGKIHTYDIDDEPKGFLLSLVTHRKQV